MGAPSLVQIIILVVLIFLVIVPIVLVAISNRVSGWQKLLWVVGAVIFSWLAYIALRITTKNKLNEIPE